MSRINLLPPEIRRERANAGLARRITFFGVALAVLLAGLYGIRTWEIFILRGDLEAAQARQVELQAKIDEYADTIAQEAAVDNAEAVVRGILAGEISWSEQLLELSTVVPPGFILSSVSANLAGDATGQIVGSMTWSAAASSYVSAELWLARLEAQEGWANGWIGSAIGGKGAVALSGSVDLTVDAITARGGGPA